MTDTEGAQLIQLAHQAIAHSLGQGTPPVLPTGPQFNLASPVFVTLRIESQLRGCMGTLDIETPLLESVRDCALAAAFRDPRFPPVDEQDVDRLEIEVSLLSSFRTIHGPDDIRIGSDGLLIQTDAARGLLLPKVAVEFQADACEFLRMVCRKASLPEDGWEDALVQAFTVQAFRSSAPR